MESIRWIDENLKENFAKKYYYNSKYIALLLRLADYIDFDSQRAPQYLLEHKHLGNFSYVEWKKHAVVCNQDKVDEESREIFFDIECDDFNLYCKLIDTLDLMSKEIFDSVSYSKQFVKPLYHLRINDKTRINIVTKGFKPEKFSFTLDYYKVTNLLMGENLYGDKKCGLRELLQNCFDACSVMKEYYSISDPTLSYTPQVSIIYNYDDNTVVIKDNGTGMSKDIIANYFLAIGKSYYRSDEYGKLGYKINPTGTFGIGFLACFMLSHKVTVYTKYYESGETHSFLLDKDSRYICYLDKKFVGTHGTAIALSMDEFNEVFSWESIISYIDRNFYSLNVKMNVYFQKDGKITLEEQAEAKKLTNFLNIDLSHYLEGIECRANLVTLIDEFKLYNNFFEVKSDDYNIVLFSSNGIQLIHQNSICEHRKKVCLVLYSKNLFEELIIQTFFGDEYFRNELDIDEIICNFEKYGFETFEPNFNPYLEAENEEWWIDSVYELTEIPICVIWDVSLKKINIQEIVQKTKMRYLLDIGAISISPGLEGYIVNSGSVYEGAYPNEFVLSYQPDSFITSYHTSVCYRGVLLEDVNLRIPFIANILIIVDIAVNILSDEFIPSVTRSKLTSSQEHILSYAIGRAVHMYLIDLFSKDKDIALALKNFFKMNYSTYNLFCRHQSLDREYLNGHMFDE
ncbi:MAG: ATP-binding protein [Butyrivibrio sp.]|nr:ATP-binding protein [Butyrivibrio sp.]